MTSTPSIKSIEQLKKAVHKELHAILGWWIKHMIDHEHGGFYGRMDIYNNIHPDEHKGIILNTRILWTFAAAARLTGADQYKTIANRAYQYLLEHFWDGMFGGVYWMINHKGGVVNGKKQIYAQSFAIYAFSEYYRLTGDEISKDKAIELFWLIERYSRDKARGGYIEAFSPEWESLEDLRLSEKDANAAKTMNTHLHILEGYTNLYRIYKHDTLKQALQHLIESFLNHFIDQETYHLNLFFDLDWQLLSSEISFGHDIEASWLLVEAAEVLGDEMLLTTCKQIAVKMAEVTSKKGFDVDNGLYNEGEDHHITDSDKHWWPQAEAVVGFLNAYQISNNKRFMEIAFNSWNFIENYIKDPVGGEWHWMVDQKGNPILGKENKAGPWKAPYHNGRACMECMERLTCLVEGRG